MNKKIALYFLPFTDVKYNLALEETFLRNMANKKRECVLFWRNDPCVVLGRHQNPFAEINFRYAQNNSIQFGHRLSGGGAVYQDLGNLNLSHIKMRSLPPLEALHEFMASVKKALEKLGCHAQIDGRNDLAVNGKKISGSGIYFTKDWQLAHCCILHDCNLEAMEEILKPAPEKLLRRGVRSVKSRVFNLKDVLPSLSLNNLIKTVAVEFSAVPELIPMSYIGQAIKLVAKRNKLNKSGFQDKLQQTASFSQSFSWGKLEVKITMHNEILQDFRISGDFLSEYPIAHLEALIAGKNKKTFGKLIRRIDFERYFLACDKKEIKDFFTGILEKL